MCLLDRIILMKDICRFQIDLQSDLLLLISHAVPPQRRVINATDFRVAVEYFAASRCHNQVKLILQRARVELILVDDAT